MISEVELVHTVGGGQVVIMRSEAIVENEDAIKDNLLPPPLSWLKY